MEQHHPSTLEELLDILESILSNEALDDLRELKRHTLIDMESSFGQFISDHLIPPNENRRALYENRHRDNLILVNPR